jgi:catechol 2,3-dioxygenase-like lactoylglutathione lyase family enzyme
VRFDHVTIRVGDPAESERFYDTVLAAIGAQKSGSAGEFGEGCAEFAEWDDFSIAAADDQHPATTGLHVGFSAHDRDDVDRFWQAGVDAGFRSDGEPGMRPQYRPDYYGAFLLDPDGNSIEAVNHGGVNRHGSIDHLWIRVANLDAVVDFYALVAEHTGFPRLWEFEKRVHFGAMGSHFALVEDAPTTQNLHIAFSAADNHTVDAFHAAAVAAGHPDNGAPGERPQYHPGYYGAFVLDPAGANVEVVNHNRT